MTVPPGTSGGGAADLVAALARGGRTVAVAESLTGGLLAAAFVAVPGASAVLRGGILAYATDLKADLLGVPADLLAARGPVDADVAAAMAAGARRRCGADWGVATTGVAGPGPQDGVPAGRAFVAVAGSTGTRTRRFDLPGDRAEVRNATVREALVLLRESLAAPPP
ncbi:competence damage-inducible protein A [Pilimelia anulata]|uniref:Competence damage-inducible protein A n=1 Tax=Pilimelia anulata TaxID=53371 RepID=A0A8J3B066_9ACTN|nr:CinA family protein [Pilimelia anulata]GGJ77349.1 competence damage-inducible protein A [Pilimelia anulata]